MVLFIRLYNKIAVVHNVILAVTKSLQLLLTIYDI